MKIAWFTDTHLNLALPWTMQKIPSHLNASSIDAVLLTGDISNGRHVETCLSKLARRVSCPIYFVLGNHDYHDRTIASVHDDMRRLTSTHKNLTWMTESDVVTLTPGVALIGTEGWYDASVGDPTWLKYTIDWFRTYDFRTLSTMDDRIGAFRDLASRSSILISQRLQEALAKHDTVFIMTHFPPWLEATRAPGTRLEKFWLPYNTNVAMGKEIERVMKDHPNKRVVVLAGHTHTDCRIRISDNVECRVNKARYYGALRDEEIIMI